MPSPLINEEMILGVLDVPVNPMTAPQLHSGAVLSAVDAFDRKLLRAPYVELVTAAFGLAGAIGRYQTLLVIEQMFKAGDMSLERIETALANTQKTTEIHRSELKRHMDLVIQCPWDGDRLH